MPILTQLDTLDIYWLTAITRWKPALATVPQDDDVIVPFRYSNTLGEISLYLHSGFGGGQPYSTDVFLTSIMLIYFQGINMQVHLHTTMSCLHICHCSIDETLLHDKIPSLNQN